MEKYFIATEDSQIYKAWFDYKADKDRLLKAYNQFAKEQGIESLISNLDKELVIVPTEKDIEAFKSQFKKCPYHYMDDGRPAFEFKANSKIYKSWNSLLQASNIKSLREPKLVYYINAYGHSRSKILECKGVLYCKYQNDDCKFELPDGCTEILGSEYHKIIEDIKGKEDVK